MPPTSAGSSLAAPAPTVANPGACSPPRFPSDRKLPHAWDAGVYDDESTGTLLCGDLFTAVGKSKALVSSECGYSHSSGVTHPFTTQKVNPAKRGRPLQDR